MIWEPYDGWGFQRLGLELKTQVVEKSQQIFLPHVMFSDLYHKYPSKWQAHVAPSVEVIEGFWAAMADHPLVQCTPIRGREGYQQHCIPIRVHGDEVPVVGVGRAWQKLFLVLSWTFRSSRLVQNLISADLLLH